MKIIHPIIVSIAAILILAGCDKSNSSLEVAVMTGDGKTGAELETEMWQRDIDQFNAMLRKLVETAGLPDKEELKKEIENRSGRAEVLTDGRGGVVDFNAAKGTIQHEANELIGSGRPHIDWEFELAGDSRVKEDKSAWFAPKIAQIVNDGDGKKERFRFFIRIEETDAGPFKAGDRIRLRASIDDFSRFENGYLEATGLVAIYYLDDAPNPFFELKLDKAEVTLLEAKTSEQEGGQPATPPRVED